MKLTTPGPRVAAALLAATGAALAAAPAASAQAPATSLRLSALTGVPSTIQAGDAFTLRLTVANTGRTTARSPRFFVGLTRGTTAKTSIKRLATRNLSPYRAGRRGSSSIRVRIQPDSSGSYRFVVCATQSGRRARCVLGRQLTVTKIPRPATPATPSPGTGTPATPATPAAPLPLDTRLRNAISQGELLQHTNALADIADANGGNRAAGTQGYDDSVGYVFNRLAKAGYEPKLDRFEFVIFSEDNPPVLTASGVSPVFETDYISMSYSGTGDTGTKAITPVDLGPTPTPDTAPPSTSTSGCEATDFAGFPAGTIALVKRGTCDFADKAQNAIDAGAAGVIIMNEGQPGREALLNGTLGGPLEDGANVPVVGVTAALGEALAAQSGPTGRIVADSQNTPGSSTNVIADTPGGDAAKTVVVGAHLDSVDEGAGINDNGSGTAFTLELAEQMSALGITPANKVRFAFWGAEEAGLIGSTEYVFGLSDAAFNQIGLNLNFDMLGSPNHARFVYDGDFSDSPEPAGAFLAPGSAEVEQTFKEAFASRGLGTLPSAFDGRSDYKPFQDNGIPAGGLFSGAEGIMTPAEAALFGGTAGVAYDPNYHQVGDDRDNLDLQGFEEMADAAASVSLKYATAPQLPLKFGETRSATSTKARNRGNSEWLGKRLRR